MKTTLSTAATTAGANQVIYDRKAMQNILIDRSSVETICLIDEINESELVIASNGIDELFTIRVAFVRQVNLEETAELNNADMNDLKTICKKFVKELIISGSFKKFESVTVRKHQENETDFNAIGFELTLKLTLLEGYAEC
jgi:hypothetical protein